ncbi:cysteine desulfurase [Hoeflea marina]|uniref:Cysteine desulfurase n=1 Tax=Hoeflea marina TaxID=274592 RepID=A0A317PTQ3_9HYPH|nr:cysteine desulfurase family protein [Hoeflea marina]PWW04317.1 cysteine desulfurase [Hoeflea marina]
MADARVYLDHNATAPLRPAARDAMIAALSMTGNPSSVHAEGRAMRAMIGRARQAVADLCGTTPARVTFTSGATEAANLALSPDYRMGRAALKIAHLYVSGVEHPCVLSGGRFPADAVTVLPVDAAGRLDLDALDVALSTHDAAQGQAMLALQLANNETGVIQPVAEAARIVHARQGLVVVDAVQGAGRMSLSLSELGADFLFVSAHKIGGPAGCGALVASGEILMPAPLIRGGGQEKGHRGGTENSAAIIGFGAAAIEAMAEAAASATLRVIRDRIEARIRALAPDVIIHGAEAERLANTIFFSLPGLKAETSQIGFDMEGIAVSAGSACSSGKVGTSHVLAAMGADDRLGAIRVSIGHSTTDGDVDRFLAAFETINSRRLSRQPGAHAA